MTKEHNNKQEMMIKRQYITPSVEVVRVDANEAVCLQTVSQNAQGGGLAKQNTSSDYLWDDDSWNDGWEQPSGGVED